MIISVASGKGGREDHGRCRSHARFLRRSCWTATWYSKGVAFVGMMDEWKGRFSRAMEQVMQEDTTRSPSDTG